MIVNGMRCVDVYTLTISRPPSNPYIIPTPPSHHFHTPLSPSHIPTPHTSLTPLSPSHIPTPHTSLTPSPHHQLILCREYTRAEDQDWHVNHFCCLRCDTGLGGKKYRPQDGQPFCLSCYEISFSTICEVHCICVTFNP